MTRGQDIIFIHWYIILQIKAWLGLYKSVVSDMANTFTACEHLVTQAKDDVDLYTCIAGKLIPPIK